MMSLMGLLRLIPILFLFACSHTSQVTSVTNPDEFVSKINLTGEGKARLEIGEESWVFSFDANFTDEKTWLMALQVPTQGELVFAFPGLDRPFASIAPEANDFRWRIVHALRETSDRRNLGYPQAGRDFIQQLHHLLRWVKKGDRPGHECRVDGVHQWVCVQDKQPSRWVWRPEKQELEIIFELRPDWTLVANFKNLTGPIFKRVTLEIIRRGEQKNFVELRQELFLSTP